MADNYIERQYEQYEARKAAWEKKRKQGKKKAISVKPQPKDLTDNTIKLPRKAFITGGADGIVSNSERIHRYWLAFRISNVFAMIVFAHS